MKKFLIVSLSLITLLVLALGVNSYFGIFGPEAVPDGERIVVNEDGGRVSPEEESEPVELEFEIFAEGLYVPWDIVFTSEERMLVTERNGNLRQIVDGSLLPEPVHVFSQVSAQSEEGLMGMTLDPNYDSNNFAYVCYAYPGNGELFDRVVRFTDEGDSISNVTTIIDRIPAAQFHAGCRIRFGPDGKLYITTGDATDADIAQDLSSLGGKILRINSDGSIPGDNPIDNSPIFSFGHRNPQGIDWDPLSGLLYETEHGPSGFDGPRGGDEINLIEEGENYGWPILSHDESREGYISPLVQFTPAIAPGSGEFYESDLIPQFTNHFIIGGLVGEGIIDVELTGDRRAVASYQRVPGVEFGRIRTIVEGPEGYIYFTTSNRDGRGTVRENDDKIYRIIPSS